MKIRIYSDIHNEIRRAMGLPNFDIPVHADDCDTVLILAGDIDKCKQANKYVNSFADRFKAVIHVAGNHEYYSGHFPGSRKHLVSESDNVHFLERESVEIGGVLFHGATLFVDYGHNPLSMLQAKAALNDFRHIRLTHEEFRLLRPEIYVLECEQTLYWLDQQDPSGIVVTHYAPSFISDRYHDANGPSYCSNLDHYTDGHPLWIHGHTHNAEDYMIGDCRIVSNPVGYPGEWCNGFSNLGLQIDV